MAFYQPTGGLPVKVRVIRRDKANHRVYVELSPPNEGKLWIGAEELLTGKDLNK